MSTQTLKETDVEIIQLINEILADQFVLYTKARNYHWNVTGPLFYNLHAAFEKIYDGLAEDIDSVAERIRTLGYKTPGTMHEFLSLSSLKEEPGKYPVHSVMVKNIVNDFETVIQKLNSTAVKLQDNHNDEISAGMFYGMAEKYQKTVWMLRATLEN
jgi:starvation-inducible DNA-binding protein